MTGVANIIYLRTDGGNDRSAPHGTGIRRPRLLMAAARAGLAGWRRERDLRRLLRCDSLPSHRRALEQLLLREAQHDEARRADRGDHDLRGHILVLIAIMAEMRALAEAETPAAPLFRPRLAAPKK